MTTTFADPGAATAVTPVVREEVTTTPPSRDEVISAIVAEVNAANVAAKVSGSLQGRRCTRQRAGRFLAFLERAVDDVRKGANHHILTSNEMDAFHDLLNLIMPDDKTAEGRSAHRLIERLILNPKTEVAVMHTSVRYQRRDRCGVGVHHRLATVKP